MERKKAGFWILLSLVNILGLGFAIRLYVQASPENHTFATFVLLLVMFVLAVADMRSALPH
jgi:hypothetical protein